MRNHRKRQGAAARRPGRWLRPVLAFMAAGALWAAPGVAFAQTTPLPKAAANALPAAPTVPVPRAVPQAALPTAAPPAPKVAPPTAAPIPPLPVAVPAPAPTPALPPVKPVAPPPVPQPVSSLPPVPPPNVPLPTAPPVPAPNAQLPAQPQVSAAQQLPSLPDQGAAAALAGTPGVPGTSGAGSTPGLAAGAQAGSLAVSGSTGDPSASLAVDPAQARFSVGERDYSSTGSAASTSGSAGAGTTATDPSLQGPSPVATVCPQLAFAPMISGCQTVLAPLNGPLSRLAHTGTPIALALAGLVFMVLGAIIYRRTRLYPQGRPSRRLKGVPTR
jgi:hypothetical protein